MTPCPDKIYFFLQYLISHDAGIYWSFCNQNVTCEIVLSSLTRAIIRISLSRIYSSVHLSQPLTGLIINTELVCVIYTKTIYNLEPVRGNEPLILSCVVNLVEYLKKGAIHTQQNFLALLIRRCNRTRNLSSTIKLFARKMKYMRLYKPNCFVFAQTLRWLSIGFFKYFRFYQCNENVEYRYIQNIVLFLSPYHIILLKTL